VEADDVGGGVHAPDSGGGLCQLDCRGTRDIRFAPPRREEAP
jgi:hypothetical protein